MRNTVIIAAVSALCLSSFALTASAEEAVTTSAVTTVAPVSADIAALQAQVAALMEQIKKLKGEVVELRSEISELTRALRVGDKGDDVKLLQKVLATDPSIYPEGKVTGFFGPKTEMAVKRFQEQNGIDKVGKVGPKTMEHLNTILSVGAGKSGMIPSGLLKEHGRLVVVPLHAQSGDTMMALGKAMISAKDETHTKVVIAMRDKDDVKRCLPTPMMGSASGTAGMMPMKCMPEVESTTTETVKVVHPAHIHMGTCAATGAVKYPLSPVVGGESETVLDVSLADLLKQHPLYVNVHKSADELSVSIACGNINAPAVFWKSGMGTATPKIMMEKPKTDGIMNQEVKKFDITSKNYSYSVPEIRVKKGDLVGIALRIEDGFHDLVIDELGVSTGRGSAGDVKTVKFIASKAGTFEYYCSVGTHRAMGMVGKLIVEDVPATTTTN